jgi:hypothetical protein
MPKGVGIGPAGFFPAGWGLPDVGPPNIDPPLPDPLTGGTLACRLIDYTVGDYVFSPDGRIAGMNAQQQNVMLALLDGNIFAGLTVKGPNYQRQVADRVTTALNPLISRGWVQLLKVLISDPGENPDATGTVVVWRDLTLASPATGQTRTPNEFQTAIPVT